MLDEQTDFNILYKMAQNFTEECVKYKRNIFYTSEVSCVRNVFKQYLYAFSVQYVMKANEKLQRFSQNVDISVKKWNTLIAASAYSSSLQLCLEKRKGG